MWLWPINTLLKSNSTMRGVFNKKLSEPADLAAAAGTIDSLALK